MLILSWQHLFSFRSKNADLRWLSVISIFWNTDELTSIYDEKYFSVGRLGRLV